MSWPPTLCSGGRQKRGTANRVPSRELATPVVTPCEGAIGTARTTRSGSPTTASPLARGRISRPLTPTLGSGVQVWASPIGIGAVSARTASATAASATRRPVRRWLPVPATGLLRERPHRQPPPLRGANIGCDVVRRTIFAGPRPDVTAAGEGEQFGGEAI